MSKVITTIRANDSAGLTIKELKEIVKNLPETKENGEPTEVWLDKDWLHHPPCIQIEIFDNGDIQLG